MDLGMQKCNSGTKSKKNAGFIKKNAEKICIVQKKSVPLHPQLRNSIAH